MRFTSARGCLAASLLSILVGVDAAVPRSAPAGASARVQFFAPEGTVKKARQVTARFDAAMVALGDARLADPFTIDCPAKGHGRWADGRNWVYDFDADLPAGVQCRFSLRVGLTALDGTAMAGRRSFSFDTGGPAIIASFPREGWQDADEDQVFLLKLDAPATVDSVHAHAFCVVDGVSEEIPVEVLTGSARMAVLAQRAALGYAYYELLWKNGAASNVRVRDRALEEAEELVTVVKCHRQLPAATRVQLVWGKGIATTGGMATTADQQLAFRVRPTFTVQVQCSRTNVNRGCIPLLPITVSFSSMVPRTLALGVRLTAADGTVYRPEPPLTAQEPALQELTFKGPFPDAGALTVTVPAGLVDDAGRKLENAARFPLALNIDEYPPLAKFSGDFGILEADEGGVLPVTLRNVEPELPARRAELPARVMRIGTDPAQIAQWLRRVQEANEPKGEWAGDGKGGPSVWHETTGEAPVFGGRDTATSLTITKPLGQRPFEVVGIPLKTPGFYVVELASRALGASLLGRDVPRYVSTSALVTNLAVHFKWGRETSRVWVTRLSDGKPLADADVTVNDYCSGSVRWHGRTDRDGIAAIGESLGDPNESDRCASWAPPPLIIIAQKGDDFSFAVSSWSQGIGPSDFGLQTGSKWDAAIVHTVLDRPLFRAGETVSMKHFLRQHRMQGVAVAEGVPAKFKVTISHLGSDQRYELSSNFGADGVGEQRWTIPKEAKLGDYSIAIVGASGTARESGRFKVEEFRLPSMRATVQGPARPLVNPREVTLDLHVAYMSGGGAGGIPVTVRTIVEPRRIEYPGYEDFQFGGAPVKEGIVESAGGEYDYDFEGDASDAGGGAGGAASDAPQARVLPMTLDAEGAARITVPKIAAVDGPAQLTAELEYADANGELLTSVGRVRLLPSAVSLGIRREGWVASSKQLRFKVLALDLDAKPIAKQAVDVTLYQATAYSYRKRLIGGFYAYDTVRETRKLATQCSGATDAQGLLVCEVAPGVSGEVLLRAESRDVANNLAGATTSIWVAGEDDWWFGGTSGDRMDVQPESKEYESGQIARFQVRMPFRNATALVTVEREGIVDSFVTQLSGKSPMISVPIKDNYAPNVYISVLAVRGRVAHSEQSKALKLGKDEEITARVDLNKPAYRLGLAEVRVGWKPHRLTVEVKPEQLSYRVRDNAKVHVHVTRANGTPLPAGTEVAVAAVDDALLELAPNPSWALLDAMMGKRGLEVRTSTAQMQVVGKRHYGRKAVPHGGGGGRERARELFDSLLAWRSRVLLDANGDATISIPLNDSLSSFRIVAIAHNGAELYGTGSASIATTQDLILLSGLPPLVREGDKFAATFTLRNLTDHGAQVELTPKTRPVLIPAPQSVRAELKAGEARDIVWQAVAPVGATTLAWTVGARQIDGDARDTVKIAQSVIPAFPVRTYQATIAQLTVPWSIPTERPKRAVVGRGGLEVGLRAHLSDGLDGIREYMGFYPYACLEQNVSRAVALRDRSMWVSWMARLPAYADRDGLLKYFPSEQLDGEDTLTAYVLAVAQEAGWEIPESSRQRSIDALTGFVAGRIVRGSALPTADLAIRKLAAIDALSRYGAGQPGMLDSIAIEPNLWPTSAVLDWLGILERLPGIAKAAQQRRIAETVLRSRLNFQGTTLGLSTERSDALWWLMISGDSNSVRMLLAVLNQATWREDIPRLVRGAIGRQQRGHWNTTVANAWGVLALEKFSAGFESTPVTGATAVKYGATQKSVSWSQATTAPALDLPWLNERASLDVTHGGTGAPWIMVRATAALPLDAPLSAGYKINRTVTPITQAVAGHWTRGDVARVRLELEAQSDMTWVVVDDPVPGGASILGSGLGGQSQILKRGEARTGWVWPAFEERRFEAFRSYYRFVPKGKWTVEYTVRLNNPGTFLLPATRVEAMYAPEMLGELPNAVLVVGPTQ